jgi:trehalose 2-sulfotransferase
MNSGQSSKWTPYDHRYDFRPYAGTPQHSYLIASTQRSGSYFLSHLLHSSGQMGAPLEYLHPAHAPKWQEELAAEGVPAMLRKLFERRTSPNGWFGIKAHWDHLEFGRQSGLDDVLRFDRFIRIERRDRVAQAVSLAMARQTRAWLSMQEQTREPRYSDGDIARAMATLDNQSRNWERWAVASGVTPVHVYYEDLVADPLGVANGILREFGLSPMAALPSVPTRKQASSLNAEWKWRYLRPSARAKRYLKTAVKKMIGRA